MLRKTIKAAAVLLVIAALLLGAAVLYVRPAETLDLAYEPVSVSQKLLDIVKTRKPEVHLTGRELNDLVKMKLAERPQLNERVTIEGARLEQRGDRLTAYVNLKTIAGVRVGAALDFALEWKAPELVVRHTGTRIRDFTVPPSWLTLDPVVVPIDDSAVPLVKVKAIAFLDDGVRIDLGLK
ncbi:hypothetical protein [Paenibacillus flagellatus]|uniref:DUF2140 domain-containing protein n=1 Tax=Paenibacillus flagellatus TaxID=2211139 RepID=A0A2V5KDX1_9BACL|nr:hypothetical protein [Paenibacillus flagellatus]PYI52150.1 hypothetical protein DLM86_21985 [Paenibacillus flagellatus]